MTTDTDTQTTTDLYAIAQLETQRRSIEADTTTAVRRAREGGATWKQIARSLGVSSPQVAHYRYINRIN